MTRWLVVLLQNILQHVVMYSTVIVFVHGYRSIRPVLFVDSKCWRHQYKDEKDLIIKIIMIGIFNIIIIIINVTHGLSDNIAIEHTHLVYACNDSMTKDGNLLMIYVRLLLHGLSFLD